MLSQREWEDTMLLDRLWDRGKKFLGVRHPIMCGGMTWVSNITLMHAVSKSGGFPVFAGGNMAPELFEKEIDSVIGDLNGPFAVNLITIAPNFKTHLEILSTKEVPFVVFAGNFPRKGNVMAMKAAGRRTLAFASTRSIAEQMIGFGIDGLILEGSEAGGHIGYVSLIILLQQVLFETKEVPVFVAGGIAKGAMIAHLLTMGASGVQLGTRFVASTECTAHPDFKEAFLKAKARQAISTPQYDSKLPVVAVRAIKNNAMDEFGRLQLRLIRELEDKKINREKAQYDVENFWVGSLRNAVVDGDVQGGSLMAGQSVGLVDRIMPLQEIMQELVDDAEKELQRMKTMLA
jgi:enoyl-[acyl-carrier protein] reductase II